MPKAKRGKKKAKRRQYDSHVKAFRARGKIAQSVFGRTRIEKKYTDVALPNIGVCNVAPGGDVLNATQVGAAAWQRIGRKIQCQYLQLDVSWSPDNASTVMVQQDVRLLIFIDRQANGVAPSYADVIKDVTPNGVATSPVHGFYNQDNKQRFTILKDIKLTMPMLVASATRDYPQGMPPLHSQYFIPLKGLTTTYNGTANPATLAEIASNAIYVMGYGAGASGAAWNVDLKSRLCFLDV